MEPKKQTPTTAANENDAADHMKLIVSEYDLPESYQSLVNGPWRLIAQTVIQQFGEDSDAWSRMTWFTRILCTAIETSLNRNTPDAVHDALNGFSIWLNSLREEGEAYSMCVSAANYAQRRISMQITEDTVQEVAPEAADEEFVLPGADAVDLEVIPSEKSLLEEAVLPEPEPEPAPERTDETIAQAPAIVTDLAKEAQQDPFDSLSLSLAYSANESTEDTSTSTEQNSLPETTERGTDMDSQAQAAVEETTTKQFEASTPGTDASSGSDRLTDAASISPVPMGSWLAFHDQDTPTLARLAMYDTANESFMLGNKNGILVRKIEKSELSALIESGLVQLVQFQAIN